MFVALLDSESVEVGAGPDPDVIDELDEGFLEWVLKFSSSVMERTAPLYGSYGINLGSL